MNDNQIAHIELKRREDGKIRINYIQWNGTPWDGLWQYDIISEEKLNEILKMIPKPNVPEKCADCENLMTITYSRPKCEKVYQCRLEGQMKVFNGKTDMHAMTIEDFVDKGWLTGTPDWCPLKDKDGGEWDVTERC